MTKSNFAENAVLDWCVGRSLTTITAYVALYTAAPSDTGGGTEVTGGAYARAATTTASWGTATGGSVSNSVNIDFPQATASWGTVTHFGILDAATSGNLIRWAALTASKLINSGDTARFATGTLTLTED